MSVVKVNMPPKSFPFTNNDGVIERGWTQCLDGVVAFGDAIQALETRCAALETKVAALETANTDLNNRVATLEAQ